MNAMSRFEDHLWQEVVREHGGELVRHQGRGNRFRRGPLAVSLLGIAGVGTALTLLVGVSGAPAAFAVTQNRNGTVTVMIKDASGIKGTNSTLRALGIRALVATNPPSGCTQMSQVIAHLPSARGAELEAWTFNPAVVTSKQWLVLTTRSASSGQSASGGSSYVCPNTVVHDVTAPSGPSGPTGANTAVHDLGGVGAGGG
jgi:hypothetical protein